MTVYRHKDTVQPLSIYLIVARESVVDNDWLQYSLSYLDKARWY